MNRCVAYGFVAEMLGVFCKVFRSSICHGSGEGKISSSLRRVMASYFEQVLPLFGTIVLTKLSNFSLVEW